MLRGKPEQKPEPESAPDTRPLTFWGLELIQQWLESGR